MRNLFPFTLLHQTKKEEFYTFHRHFKSLFHQSITNHVSAKVRRRMQNCSLLFLKYAEKFWNMGSISTYMRHSWTAGKNRSFITYVHTNALNNYHHRMVNAGVWIFHHMKMVWNYNSLTYVEEKLNKMGKILNPCFSENQASFLSLDKRAFNVNVSSGKK